MAQLQAPSPHQPTIVADHLQQPPAPGPPAQPSEQQGAAKPAEKDSPADSAEALCPWLEPSFYVSTSKLQAVKEPEAAKGPV